MNAEQIRKLNHCALIPLCGADDPEKQESCAYYEKTRLSEPCRWRSRGKYPVCRNVEAIKEQSL